MAFEDGINKAFIIASNLNGFQIIINDTFYVNIYKKIKI